MRRKKGRPNSAEALTMRTGLIPAQTVCGVAAVLMIATTGAIAGGSSIGLTVTSDREADDFAKPKDSKFELDAGHTFENGATIGGSVTYANAAFRDGETENVEGTIGFHAGFEDALSIKASAGIGEHFQGADQGDFPYYVFRIAMLVDLSERVTWTPISYRFRDAFDTSNEYRTPQVATGLAYKLGDHGSISGKLSLNWSNGDLSSTGVSLGYKFGF